MNKLLYKKILKNFINSMLINNIIPLFILLNMLTYAKKEQTNRDKNGRLKCS